jgi:pimeloyl-ACP methyl ester carboxylesterase
VDLTVPPEEWPLEGYISSDVFHEVFAADLTKAETDVMAAAQRPAALQTLGEPSGPPAWETIPSWYLVAGRDNAIGTELERFMAKRMGAKTIEIKGASHVVMISRPDATTRLILDAAGAKR